MSSFMLRPLCHNINNIAAIFESNRKIFSEERHDKPFAEYVSNSIFTMSQNTKKEGAFSFSLVFGLLP
jgi:hypothetical protein